MWWIGHVRFEKSSKKLIRLVSCIRCSTRTSSYLLFSQWPNRGKHMKTWVLGIKRLLRHTHFDKSSIKFVHPVLCIWGTTGPSSSVTVSLWQNRTKRIKTWVLGLICWVGHVRFEKGSEKFTRPISCIRRTTWTSSYLPFSQWRYRAKHMKTRVLSLKRVACACSFWRKL